MLFKIFFITTCSYKVEWMGVLKSPRLLIQKKKFDELRLMTSEQKSAVCKRLLRVSSTPWNLQAAISGGMDCFDSIKELTSTAVMILSQNKIRRDSIFSILFYSILFCSII